MECTIGLIQPSRKIVHQVGNASARLGDDGFTQCLAANGVDRSDPRRVKQSDRIAHFYLGLDRCQAQTHGDANGNLGMNLDQARPGCKSLRAYAESIDTKSQVLDHVATVRTHLECAAKLIALAHQFGVSRERRPLWVTYLNAQFATYALRVRPACG